MTITRIPALRHRAMAYATYSRGGSSIPHKPTKVKSLSMRSNSLGSRKSAALMWGIDYLIAKAMQRKAVMWLVICDISLSKTCVSYGVSFTIKPSEHIIDVDRRSSYSGAPFTSKTRFYTAAPLLSASITLLSLLLQSLSDFFVSTFAILVQ